MASQVQVLGLGLAESIGDRSGWLNTAASLQWHLELDRQELRLRGKQCYVVPIGQEPGKPTRGGNLPSRTVEMHIAVIQPMGSGAEAVPADGVVEQAEQLMTSLLAGGVRVSGWRCVEVAHEPVISRDYAREWNTWVSYLRTFWMLSI